MQKNQWIIAILLAKYMQVIRKEKNLKKNRSKDLDFNPKHTCPCTCLLFSLNKNEKRKKKKRKRETKELHTLDKMRISKFPGVKAYVPAPQSLQRFHTLLRVFSTFLFTQLIKIPLFLHLWFSTEWLTDGKEKLWYQRLKEKSTIEHSSFRERWKV